MSILPRDLHANMCPYISTNIILTPWQRIMTLTFIAIEASEILQICLFVC